MPTKIQTRRATAAQWTSVNPILAHGEIGYEVDTDKFKIGNGSTPWNSISTYFRNNAYVDSSVATEAAARIAADNAEATTRATADTNEATARTNADNVLTAADAAETAARIAADNAEASTRAAADTNLENTKVSTTNTTVVAVNRTKYLEAYASLAAAIAAIGSTPTELKITTNATVSTSATVPATTKVTFEGDGKFTVAAGQTLTIGLMTDPGSKQVFAQADATANIRFSRGAVSRINLAWFVGPTTGATITNAMDQALASCSANGGGIVFVPEGSWLTAGNHSIPSETTIEGVGNHVDNAAGPTIIKMTATGVPILKLASPNVHNLLLQNLLIDGDNKAGVDGFYGTGSEPAGDYSGEIKFDRVTITRCVNGIQFYSSSGVWLVRAVHLLDCIIVANSAAGIKINTSNNALIIDTTNFGVSAGAYALDFDRVGNTHIKGCEFYGLPGYIGTKQVLTNTVVAPSGITGNGNAKSVVTGTQIIGSPITVTVPVTTAQTTATLIATEFRTALRANAEIDRLFKVGGTGADITLTYIVPAANDATANFTIEDDTSTGITDDTTSVITTAGVARTGMAEAVCRVGGSHGAITFQSCQDEAFKYFLVNNASDAAGLINIQGCLVQAEILLNQTCVVSSFGSSYLSRTFIDSTSGNSSRITSIGDYVRVDDAYGNTFSPPELAGPRFGSVIIVESPVSIAGTFTVRRPSRFLAVLEDVGSPTTPVLSSGHYSTVSEDKVLCRLGRTDVKGTFLYYYDFIREWATGRLKFTGNQTGFKGYDFDSDVRAVQFSMSGTAALNTTGTVSMDCGAANRYTLTPTGDVTIDAVTPVAGKTYYLTVLTSGTTDRTITFGTGFKSTGTLTTGTVSGKYFVVEFYSPDTTNLLEVRRTAAL